MSYQGHALACAVTMVLWSVASTTREGLPTTTTTQHPHPHHGENHQHHGHHKLEHHSLVQFGDGVENDVLSRNRRGIRDKINLLGVIGQLYTEQKEDQEMAVGKISKLVSDSVAPEPSKESTTTSSPATTGSSGGGDAEATTEGTGSSTTAGPYKATASQLMGVLRKNLIGLRNLLQKEWATAIQDSNTNSAAAMVEFRNSVRPFLQKNGTASG